MIGTPKHVWIVKTSSPVGDRYYHVALPSKDDARTIVSEQFPDEEYVDAKEIKNTEKVMCGHFQLDPTGQYCDIFGRVLGPAGKR